MALGGSLSAGYVMWRVRGGVLVTSLPEETVSLTSVLGHVGVDKLDGIISDGGSEDGGHGNLRDNFVFLRVNTHNGSLHLSFD